MITNHTNGTPRPADDFAAHMAALEGLRREMESGHLNPLEAVDRCLEAETHYRALDEILTHAERQLEDMKGPND